MAYNSYSNQNSGNRGGGSYQKNNSFEIEHPSKFNEFKLTDSTGNITDKLFDNIADDISKSFVTEKSHKGVSGRQTRKIFDEVKSYDSNIITGAKKWEEVKPYVQMVRSKVAYAVARAKDKASKDESTKEGYDNFMAFITCGLKQVDTAEKYHIFVCLFEAVYGFYYQRKPSDK